MRHSVITGQGLFTWHSRNVLTHDAEHKMLPPTNAFGPEMKKEDLIRITASRLAISQCEAQGVVDELLRSMRASLLAGNTVSLDGVGTLKVKMRGPRTGRDLRSGQPIRIPARRSVQFSVSSKLKLALQPASHD